MKSARHSKSVKMEMMGGDVSKTLSSYSVEEFMYGRREEESQKFVFMAWTLIFHRDLENGFTTRLQNFANVKEGAHHLV